MSVSLPTHIKRQERLEWTPGHWETYWVANAPCGMEVKFIAREAALQWLTPDKVWCHHAACDMCDAVDHSIEEHHNDGPHNWFPVLMCNSWYQSSTREGCDGVNHTLEPFGSSEDDCYYWYQGNYPNGWVYWQGDWRCGPCTLKTIIGPRS